MRETWDEFFRMERRIKRVAERAGVPKAKAAALAQTLACRPLPRAMAARLVLAASLRAAQRIDKTKQEEQMPLATLNGPHRPTCTGCPACSELAAAILANPTNPILRDAMATPTLRTLAEQQLREAPPDPYAAGLAAMRTAAGLDAGDDCDQLRGMQTFRQAVIESAFVRHLAAANPATSSVYAKPPNPYSDEALRAWRDGR